ncbi:crotonase/enoyl-CoA hydratase family protein [Sphingosinicella microcystinivorans]|uniref:crotonase/enoyl-CoA hydratase family protein n=1 Tax=Sphingosinicella microcystinivorans TaxID=335406 RepID=UPI0022F3BF3C|nr:crotonase/enoyl-CoA hydratase family protein [Sphingosinicella microcystinivorans]WBX86017.1 crotonase/enoyl-CoA hydratase family protein [Sphingosinicella microcystinivorans]
MDYETIRYAVTGGIATLTLDRPERLNAFNAAMIREMLDAFDRIDADDAVRAVIVTGAGRAFCAGADLGEGGKTFDYDNRSDRPRGDSPVRADGTTDYAHPAVRDGGGRVSLRIFQCLKPVIAAINGPAVGVGITMALPMDIRIASEDAKFGFVFTRRGIVPEACSSWFLPRIVGISKALEWCFSGRVFGADEALAGGLVSRVVPPGALIETATALAREIADTTAPVSAAMTRQMLWRMLGAAHPMEAHRIDSRAIWSRGRAGDAREGVTSFLEKRPAVFPDRVSTDLPDFFPWWDEPGYE